MKRGTHEDRRQLFKDLHQKLHDDDVTTPGCRIYAADLSEYGLVVKKTTPYQGEAGPSSRVRVVREDGEMTTCAVRGLRFNAGCWNIRS